MTTKTKQPKTTPPTTEKGDPRNNADDAFAAFMSMPESEWLNCLGSIVGGGRFQPEEQKGFERAMKARAAANSNPTSTAVTVIPSEDQTQAVAQIPPTSTAIVKYSITEADVAAIEAKRGLIVSDIKDSKQLKAVEQLHREAKKGRTTIEAERTEANKSLRAKIEDEIKWNNNAAAALQSRLNPIEEEAAVEIARVEAAQEAERVAAKNALLNGRKRLLAEAVGEYTDMLAIYPDDVLLGMGEAIFNPLLVTLGVQVEGRKQLAEQQRVAKEAADKAAADKAESDAKAEALRLKQQAIEDQQRKAEQAKLEAAREAFEKQQADAAELQRKADEERAARIAKEELDRQARDAERLAEQNAKLAAERQELESQRLAIEDERKRQETVRLDQERLTRETEQKERDRLRLEAENSLYAERVAALKAIGDYGIETAETLTRDYVIAMAEFDAFLAGAIDVQQARVDAAARAAADKIEAALLKESLKPDLEKLSEWIDRINESFTENLPVMSTEAGQELLVDLQAAMVESMEHWRGIVE